VTGERSFGNGADRPTHSPAGELTERDQDGRLTLLSKPGCHLCDDARLIIDRVASDLGIGWTEIDITTDDALYAQWWEQIPVTLIDGRQHDFWRVDEQRLRRALSAGRA
jgi:glutaredoxin